MKRRAVVVLAIAACGARDAAPPSSSESEPAIEMTTTPAVAPQQRGYLGLVAAREVSEPSSPFATNVAEVYVKVGATVKRGDKLARLDDRPLEEQLEQARSELRSLKAEIRAMSAAAGAAQARMERERSLYTTGGTSKADVVDAEFGAAQAESAVERARANAATQQSRIAALGRQIADTTLVSTIDGVVSLRLVEPGGRVEQGRPVVRVVSTRPPFVRFAIPAENAGAVKPGMSIDILVEATGDRLRGTVTNVTPELDPIAQMIIADAELVAPPADLKSGLIGRVFVAEGR